MHEVRKYSVSKSSLHYTLAMSILMWLLFLYMHCVSAYSQCIPLMCLMSHVIELYILLTSIDWVVDCSGVSTVSVGISKGSGTRAATEGAWIGL